MTNSALSRNAEKMHQKPRGLWSLAVALVTFICIALCMSTRASAQQNGENIFGLMVINQSYQDEFSELTAVERNISGGYRLFETLNVPNQNVKLLLGAGPSEIEDALFAMGDRMPDDAQLVIYYYGLGLTTVDGNDNLAVLPGLSLLERTEPRIVNRRLRRETLALETLVRDLEFTPAQQKLVIYDACSVPALSGSDDALYWQEIARDPCAPQEIAGADVIFGPTGLEDANLLEILAEVLAQDPAQTLADLQTNVQAAVQQTFDWPEDAAMLLQFDPEQEISARCLYSADPEAGICSVSPEAEEQPLSDAPPTDANAETEETGEDEQVAATTTEVEGEETAEPTIESEANDTPDTAEKDPVFVAREGDSGNAQEMQSDWNGAKAAANCEGYTSFLLQYPTSPFALKAQFELRKVCSAEELAAFEVAKADAAARSAEPSELEVAEVTEPAPEEVVESDETPVEDTAAAESEPTADADQEDVAEPEVAGASTESALQVREAWLGAKDVNTCEAFLAFQRDYPGSAFGLKARIEANRACTPEERAAFETAEAGSETEAETATEAGEPDVVADTATSDTGNGDDTQAAASEEDINPDADANETDSSEDTEIAAVDPAPTEADIRENTETTQAEDEEQPQLSSRDAWQQARRAGTCYAILNFVKDYPNSFEGLLASQEANRSCSPDQKAAFAAGQLRPDDTVLTTGDDDEAPTEGTEDVADGGNQTADQPKEISRKPTYAFVVVNDEYESEDIADVNVDPDLNAFLAILDVLEIPQERIATLRNVDRIELEEAAFSFALEMEPNSNLLVYYAGHSLSILDSKEVLIVPSAFEAPQTLQVRLAKRRIDESTIRLRDLLRDLREGAPDQLVLIHNGCGPIPLGGDDVEPYWEFTNRYACAGREIDGASILFPVTADQIAPTTSEGEGSSATPFMQVMLDTVTDDPFIGLTELARTLVWEVPQINPEAKPVLLDNPRWVEDPETTDPQRCFAPTLVDGDEVCRKVEPPVVEAEEPDPTTGDGEGTADETEQTETSSGSDNASDDQPDDVDPAVSLAWRFASVVYTCDAFREFLEVYPDTSFTDQAEAAIAELCEPEEENAQDVDTAWAEAQDVASCAAYTDFLRTHPGSPYEDEARVTAELVCEIEAEVAAMLEAWEVAQDIGTCEVYEEYLANFPDTEFDEEARSKVEELCNAEVADRPEYCSPDGDNADTARLEREGVRLVQQRLNELGCSVGGADGAWGNNSQRGFDSFLRESEVSWSERTPVCGTVARLQAYPDGRVCPVVRAPSPAPSTSSNTSSNNNSSSGGGTTTRAQQPTPQPPATTTRNTAQCGPFQRRTADGRCVTGNIGINR